MLPDIRRPPLMTSLSFVLLTLMKNRYLQLFQVMKNKLFFSEPFAWKMFLSFTFNSCSYNVCKCFFYVAVRL